MGSEGDEPNDGNPLERRASEPGNVPERLDHSLEDVLRSAGVQDSKVVRQVMMSFSATLARSSLPLPPPAVMQEYSKVLPQLPEKLVEWTETQAAHRRELENQRVWGAERRLNCGQIGALCVSLFGIAVSGAVAILGSAWAAIAIAICAVGGPTAAVLLAARNPIPNTGALPGLRPSADRSASRGSAEENGGGGR